MRENEFEKKVKATLQELDLDPAAAVWEAVERRIHKEKKRRFLFWWPLALLLAGGAITAGILLGSNKEKQVTESSVQHNKADVPPTPATPTGTTRDQQPTDNVSTEKTNHTPERKLTETQEVINKPVPIQTVTEKTPQKSDNNTIIRKTRNEPLKPDVTTKTGSPSPGREPVTALPKKDEKITVPEPPVAKTEPGKKEEPDKTPITVADKEPAVPAPIDPVVPKETETALRAPADSSIEVPAKKAGLVKPRVTHWGIAVSAGSSSITEGPGLFKSNRRLEANSLQSGSPGPQASFDRSANESSFAGSAGIWFRNQLSPRLFLEGGLGYQYLSNSIYVGTRVDSTRLVNNNYSQGVLVDNFYRPSGSQSYTNRYHFIRLHAGLSWQFLKSKNFRPEWENGLVYNRLAGSSMLHYDWNLPGYYKDNKLLTKNNLFYYTGFNIPAGKRVLFNPYASFSMTRVLRNADSLRTNYSQWGIRLKISLSKQ